MDANDPLTSQRTLRSASTQFSNAHLYPNITPKTARDRMLASVPGVLKVSVARRI
jgi:hypothetical protein